MGKKKKKEAGELPNMPARSALGQKAIEYIELKEQIERDIKVLKEIGGELAVEFRNAQRI